MHGTVNFLRLVAAKAVCNGNTGAYRQTDEQIDNQIGNRTGGTDGGHIDTAAEASNDDQVCGIKQQLQQSCQHDRNGIGNQAGPQGSFQHIYISFHIIT